MLVFSTQLCEPMPLSPSLWFNPPPFPVQICILYTRVQCVTGDGVWSSGHQTDENLPQSPFTGQIFVGDDDILYAF
jgi:hypothetical protein